MQAAGTHRFWEVLVVCAGARCVTALVHDGPTGPVDLKCPLCLTVCVVWWVVSSDNHAGCLCMILVSLHVVWGRTQSVALLPAVRRLVLTRRVCADAERMDQFEGMHMVEVHAAHTRATQWERT